MSRKFLDIKPSNLSPNGVVSYKQGQPILRFDIGAQPALLYGESVRICGSLNITYNGTDTPTALNGSSLKIDSRTGIYGAFDTITISSTKTKQTLETIRHYNRMMSSLLPVANSNNDLISHFDNSALTCPSLDASRDGVVRDGKTNSNQFCVYLQSGLLTGSGRPIPLSQDTLGGLTLELHLAPPSTFLFDRLGDASANNLLNADYTLSNVKLICEVEEMTQPSQSKMDGFEFNSVSSYYSTINSTNAQLNYALGLSRVNSVFVNFIRSNYLNNLSQNSLQTIMPTRATGQIANVNSVVFTKGGIRYPDNYVQDTNYKLDNNVSPVDPELSRKFLNSIIPFKDLTRTQISPFNTNREWTSEDNAIAQGGLVWGVGVNYNTLGSQGENFKDQAWGLEMDCELTDDNPISAFVFVNAKNTLMFNNDGVQLVS